MTGALLQATGAAWIAAAAGPGTSYLALVTPMIIIGVGFGAVRQAVLPPWAPN